MKKLIEKVKELETPQIIIYGVCGICLIVLLYGIFSGGDDDTEQNNQVSNLELPEDGKPVTNYETKMEAYGVKEEKESGIDLTFEEGFFGSDETANDSIEKQRKLDELNAKIEGIESKKNGGVYGEEDAEIIKNLQKEIENEPTKKRATPTRTTNYSKTPVLSYEERLQKAREARLGSNATTQPVKTSTVIESRVAFYRDQFKLPGDLVELVLTKDFKYRGKTFKNS